MDKELVLEPNWYYPNIRGYIWNLPKQKKQNGVVWRKIQFWDQSKPNHFWNKKNVRADKIKIYISLEKKLSDPRKNSYNVIKPSKRVLKASYIGCLSMHKFV